jgi:hypothetical protein
VRQREFTQSQNNRDRAPAGRDGEIDQQRRAIISLVEHADDRGAIRVIRVIRLPAVVPRLRDEGGCFWLFSAPLTKNYFYVDTASAFLAKGGLGNVFAKGQAKLTMKEKKEN